MPVLTEAQHGLVAGEASVTIRGGLAGLASLGLRKADIPILRDRRPAMPSRDRTVVGVGRPGCFAGLDGRISALVPDGGPYRLNLLSKLYEKDRRFHVVRGDDWDLAFYAPEGTGFHPHCDVHGHLARAFDVVSGMSECALMAEWGSHPDLSRRIAILAESGSPGQGMPTLALTCAQLSRYPQGAFPAERSGDSGPASVAYGGSVAMFSVRGNPQDAADSLAREVRLFSRSVVPLHPLASAPAETLVADMERGCVMSLTGETDHGFSDPGMALRA